MSASSLSQVLEPAGRLDDLVGDLAARERFRDHLRKYVTDVGQLMDQIDQYPRTSGDQDNRALQDLVKHLGRYRGVLGEVGFDGLWKSPTGCHVGVEVKTTEAHVVKTATLVGFGTTSSQRRCSPAWRALWVSAAKVAQIRTWVNCKAPLLPRGELIS